MASTYHIYIQIVRINSSCCWIYSLPWFASCYFSNKFFQLPWSRIMHIQNLLKKATKIWIWSVICMWSAVTLSIDQKMSKNVLQHTHEKRKESKWKLLVKRSINLCRKFEWERRILFMNTVFIFGLICRLARKSIFVTSMIMAYKQTKKTRFYSTTNCSLYIYGISVRIKIVLYASLLLLFSRFFVGSIMELVYTCWKCL